MTEADEMFEYLKFKKLSDGITYFRKGYFIRFMNNKVIKNERVIMPDKDMIDIAIFMKRKELGWV